MTVDFISLAVIAVVSALCPIIAQLVPKKLVPESVFLLAAGAILGPNLVGVIQLTEATDFLSDLGLAFLFLLAGMEINPKTLVGHEGKIGLVTWLPLLRSPLQSHLSRASLATTKSKPLPWPSLSRQRRWAPSSPS